MNVILRPVWNRPEMLALSLESEKAARARTHEDYVTVFAIEYGAPPKVLDLITNYEFPARYIVRKKHFGITRNVLEGMKAAFDIAESYVIHLEDDVVLHESYFEFMDALRVIAKEWSVLSAYSQTNEGDVRAVVKREWYSALAPLISKRFFNAYIARHAKQEYYARKVEYMLRLGVQYARSSLYKYKDATHCQQAGLINRLVDVARIERGWRVFSAEIPRQIHIGFYGANRLGALPPGSFSERLAWLRRAIARGELYAATRSKEYDDYLPFSPKLETWDGTLYVK